MISPPDFKMKQIVFVFTRYGDKLSFQNDNLIVKDKDGKTKLQCTCYRIFAIFVVGNVSITSGIIQRTQKFGFQIFLLTTMMKPYQRIGAVREGNTYLRKLQYAYDSLDLAKHLTVNKIQNQRKAISGIRNKSKEQKAAIRLLDRVLQAVPEGQDGNEVMGLEGSASRIYFKNFFTNTNWNGRKPRIKHDPVNVTLDIGYTILFGYIEAIVNCFGFDPYYGVYHRAFYMRKSLVCDLIEPFRVIIDHKVRGAINLGQLKAEDFDDVQGKYLLKSTKNAEYIQWLVEPILENREAIFLYVQSFYRAFMKQKAVSDFPVFLWK